MRGVTVHPRARGEQKIVPSGSSCQSGSSPRTRGTGQVARVRKAHTRFIPAHAGNRPSCARSPANPAVHPRARGEQGQRRAMFRTSSGSSPRTRGTGRAPVRRHHTNRFIPAHAGNRSRWVYSQSANPVHPRARGEQRRRAGGPSRNAGSSPRTRGTEVLMPARRADQRFIPAHAGNSPDRSATAPSGPVHPRARGEQAAAAAERRIVAGSSPRTRGTDFVPEDDLCAFRFIPAHAGNRGADASQASRSAVHPRARGEQPRRAIAGYGRNGSSPRTRGTAPAAT